MKSFFVSVFREGKARVWSYFSLGLLGMTASFSVALMLDQRSALHAYVFKEAQEISWVVFLESSGDRQTVETFLKDLPGSPSIRFVSKEEALENVRKDRLLSESISLTGRNPFPDSFDVRWPPLFLRKSLLERTQKRVESLEGVDHVGFDSARVAQLSLLQKILYQLEVGLMAALWVAALLLVILVGKILFFPQGPVMGIRLLLGTCWGGVGGVAGTVMSHWFVSPLDWRVVGPGCVVGLLLILWQATLLEA